MTSIRVARTIPSLSLPDCGHDDMSHSGCGLKLFSPEACFDLPYFSHIDRFMPALIKENGGKISALEISHWHHAHRKSNYGTLGRLAVGVVDLFCLAWLHCRAKMPQSLVLAYGVHKQNPLIILGQLPGTVVYLRKLIMIWGEQRTHKSAQA
ncbi:MAG TPA: hypothetical protein VN023_06080 [Methylovorus sp.]|nr:hypothetical protein [Methylovorus sp.]